MPARMLASVYSLLIYVQSVGTVTIVLYMQILSIPVCPMYASILYLLKFTKNINGHRLSPVYKMYIQSYTQR